MSISFTVNVSDAMIEGAAIGAGTMAVPVVILAGVSAIGESALSLFGSGGFLKKVGIGLAIMAPIGGAIGVGTVLAGAPAWVAAPAVLGTLGVITLGSKLLRRR